MKSKNSEIVYSTDPDLLRRTEIPAQEESSESKNQILKISLDRKQRAGKSVTVIDGFIGWSDEKIESLARALKSQCATGGTVKNRKIEIQGDQRNKIERILVQQGNGVKRIN
jgi:translation initiation factor 1